MTIAKKPPTDREKSLQELVNSFMKKKTSIKIKFKKLHPDAQLPKRAKEGDAGMDIICVDKGEFTSRGVEYSTGLAMEIPHGYVGYLFPRSSICKTDLSLSNAVGVVDSGYRGEVKAIFNINMGPPNSNYSVYDRRVYQKGDRIIQLVVMPIPAVETEWADELSDSERGQGSFGSTGK